MDKDYLIYIAGFFDGEGCIGLYGYPPNRGLTSHNIRLMVSVSNTKREVLDGLKTNFGGGVTLMSKSKTSIKWKKCYQWRVTGKQAETFLKSIYPFMRVRKPQAEVALKYRETVRDIYHHETLGKPMDLGIIEKRRGYYNRMKQLNFRGIPTEEEYKNMNSEPVFNEPVY